MTDRWRLLAASARPLAVSARWVAGPALLLALALGVVWLRHEAGPRLSRHSELRGSDLGIVPEPAWLVRRGYEIPLTAAQAVQVQQLAAAWDRDTAADREALARAGAAVRGDLDQRRLEPSRTRDYTELSAALAERRHAAWDRVWVTLSEAQRQRIRDLRKLTPLEMR